MGTKDYIFGSIILVYFIFLIILTVSNTNEYNLKMGDILIHKSKEYTCANGYTVNGLDPAARLGLGEKIELRENDRTTTIKCN